MANAVEGTLIHKVGGEGINVCFSGKLLLKCITEPLKAIKDLQVFHEPLSLALHTRILLLTQTLCHLWHPYRQFQLL